MYFKHAWSKTYSTEHCWLAWFSAHLGSSLWRGHVTSPRVLSGYCLNQLSSVKWLVGRCANWIKNNGLNQPKAQEPCIARENHVEFHALQAHSCDNWMKGTGNWVRWRRTVVAERGPTPMLHCVLQHILTVCISCAHCFAVCPCLRSCSSCHGIIDLGFPPIQSLV